MPSRDDLAVLPVSTWTLALVLVALVVFKPPVLGFVLVTLWTWLIISDLHTALPDDFYESETQAVQILGLSFVLDVVTLAVLTFRDLAVWAGVDPGWAIPPGFWVVVVLPGLALHFLLVRHVLSAVETLTDGRARKAGNGFVLLHLLVMPLFVLWSHYHARRALLG